MRKNLDNIEGTHDTVPHWRHSLSWSALIMAGWLLYELTTQPMLASIVICTKFGWEDFRAALWLRKVDPYRPRAKACFALYLASGLWKIAITASIMFFAIAMVSIPPKGAQPAPGQQNPELPGTFVGAVLTAITGYILLALATCRALWLSMRYRIRLWLSSNVHRARWHAIWPPTAVCEGSANKTQRVLLTTLFVLGFSVLMVVVIKVALQFPVEQVANQGRKGEGPVGACIVVGTILAAVLLLGLRDFLDRMVVAQSPAECWDDRTNEHQEYYHADPA